MTYRDEISYHGLRLDRIAYVAEAALRLATAVEGVSNESFGWEHEKRAEKSHLETGFSQGSGNRSRGNWPLFPDRWSRWMRLFRFTIVEQG